MVLGWQSRRSRRQWQKSQVYGRYLFVFFILALLYQIFRPRSSTPESSTTKSPARAQHPRIKEQAHHWRDLFTLVLNNDPRVEALPDSVVPKDLDIPFDPQRPRWRPDLLWIRQDDLKKLKGAHTHYVKQLQKTRLSPVYEDGTRGIVMTAGMSQLPVLLTSLRMLRRTGCALPVEIYLGKASDYDFRLCDEILPNLNARCFVVEDVLLQAETGVLLDHFQYKMMAILFSSFEEVLLLDSDNFPISDPSHVFDELPFNATGMILFPDFWYASESPYYFDIASLGTPPPLNAKPCIEAGQIFLSKPKHSLSLALAIYYNYYGPNIYYPLHSQGAPGQGDKETWGWAATVMHEEFYTVHESVYALGHTDSNGRYFGSAMAQHNPSRDYARVHGALLGSDTAYGAPVQRPQNAEASEATRHVNASALSSKPLFIHANFPKFDPSTIFLLDTQRDGDVGPCFDSNGTAIRTWLPQQEMEALFGFDVERVFWQEIEYVACQYEDVFEAFKGKREVCAQTKRYTKAVFGTGEQ